MLVLQLTQHTSEIWFYEPQKINHNNNNNKSIKFLHFNLPSDFDKSIIMGQFRWKYSVIALVCSCHVANEVHFFSVIKPNKYCSRVIYSVKTAIFYRIYYIGKSQCHLVIFLNSSIYYILHFITTNTKIQQPKEQKKEKKKTNKKNTQNIKQWGFNVCCIKLEYPSQVNM